MQGLLELDITDAREIFRCYKDSNGSSLSFTAWMVRCVAQAVSENLEVQAIKKRNKLYIFDDVDVSIIVEKTIDGKLFPALYVIRKANEKSLKEIHDEIREEQRPKTSENYTSGYSRKRMNLLLKFPRFVRELLLWGHARRNPLFLKKSNGTIQLTAVGMFGKGTSGWAINLGYHSVNLVTGGMSKKPRLINGELVNREFLNLTVKIDHIITDGAPAVRFGKRLVELIEGAYELEEFCDEYCKPN